MLKVINLYEFWKSKRFLIVFFLPEVHPGTQVNQDLTASPSAAPIAKDSSQQSLKKSLIKKTSKIISDI